MTLWDPERSSGIANNPEVHMCSIWDSNPGLLIPNSVVWHLTPSWECKPFFFYSLLCIFTILYSILMRRISALIDAIATTRKTNRITFLGDSESVVICMFDRWYHSMSPHALKILRVSCSYVYFRTWQSLENLSLT